MNPTPHPRLTLAGALLLAPNLPSAATLVLQNGDTLNGRVVATQPDLIRLDHPILGRIDVPRRDIAELREDLPDPADDNATPPAQAASASPEAKAETEAADAADDRWRSAWTRRFDLGLSGAHGKNDNRHLHLGATADYEDERTRWALAGAYDNTEADSTTNENRFFASANRDWLMPDSAWFSFARARFDQDQFKDWDYRLSATGGAGYTFVTDDTWRLLGRAGLGGNHTFGGARETFSPEALLGIEADWKLSARQSLRIANTLYPDLSERGEFRNLSQVDWRLSVDPDDGLDVKFTISNEYDSQATGSTGHNDFNYAAALSWTL